MTTQQIEFVLLGYYQEQLVNFRRRSTPWWLKPKAWLARINRTHLRKKITRNARKSKAANEKAEIDSNPGG